MRSRAHRTRPKPPETKAVQTPPSSPSREHTNNSKPVAGAHDNIMPSDHPPFRTALMHAVFYVASGVAQPLLVTLAKAAGLADPTAQLYMLFYYLGPSMVSLSLVGKSKADLPSRSALSKAGSIAVIDIAAQATNYTGAAMAGPTIFAIIYSSVTIWTAVFSRFMLARRMRPSQWVAVATVFGGLAITALHSVSIGPGVFRGSCLVLVGSSLHALTYVLSEAVMTRGERLPVAVNAAVQGIVACGAFLLWQVVYTRPRYEELIAQPMAEAGTTIMGAAGILGGIAAANLVHAVTFMCTLRHFPGGAVSAGVMKGLQAVLVFLVCHWAYCGTEVGGEEMCFTWSKFTSLVIVVGGVVGYAGATEMSERRAEYSRIPETDHSLHLHLEEVGGATKESNATSATSTECSEGV